MKNEFCGLSEETYRFFWELSFQNNKSFFECNRQRYKDVVQTPMLQLASLLGPAALEIDPDFQIKPTLAVSRIYRDTRFSNNKLPYRDHVWIGYKYPKSHTSDSFVIYAEFERDKYGYGMGMYSPNTEMMRLFRERMLARSETFLALVENPEFSGKFQTFGESYKRPRFTEGDERLLPWLNRKRITFGYESDKLSRTMKPEIADEILEAFRLMKPVYRFLQGLD